MADPTKCSICDRIYVNGSKVCRCFDCAVCGRRWRSLGIPFDESPCLTEHTPAQHGEASAKRAMDRALAVVSWKRLPPRRMALLRSLVALPEHAARFKVDVRVAEHLCRDGLAEFVGDMGKRGFAYMATIAGRKLMKEMTNDG